MTFNHEAYIFEAIDSFLAQITNFPVEIVIYDDASSDKTRDILREYKKKYPHIVKVIFSRFNKFSQNYKVIYNQFFQLKGKYIAICDGDDFWTSKNKLQLQFETLEKNPEYIFCGHLTKNFQKIKMNKSKFYTIDSILRDKFICHVSSFFFKNIFKKINKDDLPEYLFYGFNGDYALSIFLMNYSDCIVLPYTMSFYRLRSSSRYRSLNYQGNIGLIKKAKSMFYINQQVKYYFGPEVYLNITKKNLLYLMSISKRFIMSLKFINLLQSIGMFFALLAEYIFSSILIKLIKKKRKKI